MDATTHEMAGFWRQFGILLSSGVPIIEALRIQHMETQNADLQGAIDEFVDCIRGGQSITVAMGRFPQIFSTSVTALVAAGEAGGVLDRIAERIANGLQQGALPLSGGEAPTNGGSPAQRVEDGAARVAALLDEAIRARATDIHIEPGPDDAQTRVRVDGAMQPPVRVSRAVGEAMATQVMLLASFDVAERRLPQDGRLVAHVDGVDRDIRVSGLPTRHGYTIVMRVLQYSHSNRDLASLGASEETQREMERWAARPQGIHLICGPTGAGKTTLMYALLRAANTPERKLMTIENPIEVELEGVIQTQVHFRIGRTSAQLLRATLRQDPDVIALGEIRSLEVARIVVEAGLTGHLVFSTLHTRNVTEAPGRLFDMGLEPWLAHAVLQGAISTRLVRRACQQCAEPVAPYEELLASLPDDFGSASFVRGRGCDACRDGYRGRMAIHERLPMTDEITAMIREGAGPADLRSAAIAAGMVTARLDGVRKAAQGLTTLEEVARVTQQRPG